MNHAAKLGAAFVLGVLVGVAFALAWVALGAEAQAAHGAPAHYWHGPNGVRLPDPAHTPGATLEVSRAQVCRPGYAKAERDVTDATKQQVYALYGATKRKPNPDVAETWVCCEVDHLIPLALGGSNDVKNLWPQPYKPRPGAWEKDRVEAHLHREVCRGRLTIEAAQARVRSWVEEYGRAGRQPSPRRSSR